MTSLEPNRRFAAPLAEPSARRGPEAFAGAHVLVAGWGATGRSATAALTELGARVSVLEGGSPAELSGLPAAVEVITDDDPHRLADRARSAVAAGASLLVASPGWAPSHPVIRAVGGRRGTGDESGQSRQGGEGGRSRQSRQSGGSIPIWSEVELAWHLSDPATHWLTLTGTNGKTTTVGMLAAILAAAGRNAPAVGNVGVPIATTVLGSRGSGRPLDALAVELSSFQLHFTSSVSAVASAVINLADDHLDWHGSAEAYAADKGRIHTHTRRACIYNDASPITRELVERADVIEGARGIGFTLAAPAVGQVGLVETALVDRAFIHGRHSHGQVLADLSDLARLAGPTGLAPHLVADALAAAALARADDAPPEAVTGGLRAYDPGRHRLEDVATVAGVHYVDDSKATNAHAAAAALAGHPASSIVWIAGGLAKGARFDELVSAHGHRLRAAVLIGVDEEPFTDALTRHAPQVPRVRVDPGDDDVMRSAIRAAAALAHPGDTVLLAPAGASMDQFASYAGRGEAFVRAVHDLEAQA
ncbi:UDP-N-acetylmuramoyl-L-alanine--D-glutamate ligase [Pseudactinotalea sp. HY160]|uniref:UDP-N-acetylmuramoyl-L-alanine--D-glutamate ligase n=1 Tax=Pseudactinotalea sp. HY160 TaxID=2654490 RepID=UPI00130FB6BF|nr:UDP-N-acetylmuramoyl-L-alanine--D-glutamate ligase [Pseudactinotalea sp. HY160]